MEKEIIFGRMPVLEALKTENISIHKIFISKDAHGKAIAMVKKEAKSQGIPFKFVPGEKLARFFDKTVNHQGVLAQTASVKYADLVDLFIPDPAKLPLILILDGLQDVHNLGAVIRTAEAAAVSGVVIPQHHAAGLTSTAFKTSAGAAAHLPIVRMNLLNALERLKKEGYWLVGLSTKANDFIYQPDYKDLKLAVLIGTEDKDLSPSLQKKCDFLVKIPIWGRVNSLNASVAAAIIVYEIRRQQAHEG